MCENPALHMMHLGFKPEIPSSEVTEEAAEFSATAVPPVVVGTAVVSRTMGHVALQLQYAWVWQR